MLKNGDVEFFLLLLSNSQVFLEQNTATLSPETVLHSSFCTEIGSKTTKISFFLQFKSILGIFLLQFELISQQKLTKTLNSLTH